MKGLKIIIILLLVSIAMSCVEEYDFSNEEVLVPPTLELFKSNIIGDVQDEKGNPISEANVFIYVEGVLLGSTTTDIEGHYEVKDQLVSTSNNVLVVESEESGRTEKELNIEKGSSTYTLTTLLDIENREEFSSIEKIEIDNSDFSFSVEIDMLDLADDENISVLSSSYPKDRMQGERSITRTIKEDESWLDIALLIDLRVVDAENQDVKLIKDETLSVIIKEELLDENDLSVWYLNETLGTWDYGGELILGNNHPMVEIDRFGSIALAQKREAIKMSGLVYDATESPLFKAEITVVDGFANLEKSYTNSNGGFEMKLPSSENIIIKIDKDGFEPYEIEVNGLNDINLGLVTIDSANVDTSHLSQEDCFDLNVYSDLWGCGAMLYFSDFFTEDFELYSNINLTINGESYSTEPFGISFEANDIGTILRFDLGFNDADNIAQSCTGTLYFNDTIVPVAILKSNLNVLFDGEETVDLYPNSVNQGSFDNCSDVTFQILRNDQCNGNCSTSEFKEFVQFSKDEIGSSVRVVVKVSDAAGNFSIAWSDIDLQE